MFDTSSEAEAQDRMTTEGSPPPRTDAPVAAFRRDAAFGRLRALIDGLGNVRSAAGTRLRVARRVAARLKAARLRRGVLVAASCLLLLLLPPAWLVYRVYFDRSRLPEIEPFILFEPPTIGEVYDVRGKVLIQLAREYRRVLSPDELPLVLRQAILAAEDKNFYSHSGVDYGALPRVIQKTVERSWSEWTGGADYRLLLPQGGSTITQQLVRSYFLPYLTNRRDDDPLFHSGLSMPRVLSLLVGAPATNKLLRKLEEVRLSLWLEEEMGRRYGTKARAKREILARFASFVYLGGGRYGFAAASEFYFDKPLASYTLADAGKAALLAGIPKSPREFAPVAGGARPIHRRNQILALMARNGYITPQVARHLQTRAILVTAQNPVKTEAPAAIDTVFEELKQRGTAQFGVEELFQGRILVHSTIDARVQTIVNEALENGLALYEKRHPSAKGLIQGSVVVLGNGDAGILAEVGGRQLYNLRYKKYSDYNRVTGSLRQPGSAWKPLVYLTAFRNGLDLETTVPDEPIGVEMGSGRGLKWIANYDNLFKGPIPMRQALAESRNTVAVWITRELGLRSVLETARELGIKSPIQPYITTSLGASEVNLLELAGVYRAMASGFLAEPHVIARVTDADGVDIYEAPRSAGSMRQVGIELIQEGLRGVVRLPAGTAHSLDGGGFPIPVMGKTGTTSGFRDALFVGSTYGPRGITVAVRVGFDDNRGLGGGETGGRAALPIFREIMLRVYAQKLAGPVPKFPRAIEQGIDDYLVSQAAIEVDPVAPDAGAIPAAPRISDPSAPSRDSTGSSSAAK
jgi:penicillin-binding protein 1A